MGSLATYQDFNLGRLLKAAFFLPRSCLLEPTDEPDGKYYTVLRKGRAILKDLRPAGYPQRYLSHSLYHPELFFLLTHTIMLAYYSYNYPYLGSVLCALYK